ncbi:unnamed protein product [Schistosoma margrebowiei]|uniref:Uncharacterized protein n=1 Tax=Schistosoma margrebowiei TaxID=48269 RepID=A0A183MII4_9TREM|nr:unnamed protein product [Schistosoma margrebowiei]
MQEKTTSVAAVGFSIQKGKSKILRYNTTCNNRITIDGQALEDVKTVTYLDSIIDQHVRSNADMKVPTRKTRAAYPQLKNICNSN